MYRRLSTTGSVGLLMLVAGCQPQQAYTGPEPINGDVAVDIEPDVVELEAAVPITSADVGDVMVASGVVVGEPGPAGFFMRTPAGQVIFVASGVPVATGQEVDVAGPLEAVSVTMFDGWERDFLGNIDPDWDVIRLHYIDAGAVAAEVEIERAFPITSADVGDVMVASGFVVGEPGPAGFFLRAAGDEVVFVRSSAAVTEGQHVRVAGPLQAAEVTVFDGWEREFGGDLDPDWDLLRLYYIDASVIATEVELAQAFPITADDVGDVVVTTGTVAGDPGPAGFFLRTSDDDVVFVESSTTVALGREVRVAGPLQAADVAVFDGWERDLLGDVDPDWDVLRLYFIRASSVATIP